MLQLFALVLICVPGLAIHAITAFAVHSQVLPEMAPDVSALVYVLTSVISLPIGMTLVYGWDGYIAKRLRLLD